MAAPASLMQTMAIVSLTLSSILLQAQSVLPTWGQERIKKFTAEFNLVSYVKPQFHQADFSGDKIDDLAILVERKTDKKKGILFLFAESSQSFVIGAGTKLTNGGDNFEWMDTWSVFKEPVTHETTFKEDGDVEGSKEIRLYRPAIEVREEEGSGGLIYFNGKKFIWIHQGD
jgi:hypothetical protein